MVKRGAPKPIINAPAPAPKKTKTGRKQREQGNKGPGSPKAAKAEARRDALHAVIRKDGLANLDVSTFAKQHKVTRKVIYEDLKLIAIHVGERGAEVIVLTALENLRRATEEYRLILQEARTTRPGRHGDDVPMITDAVRLGAAKALAESTKAEIDALQRLGLLKGAAGAPGSGENPLVVEHGMSQSAGWLFEKLFPDVPKKKESGPDS